jgi:hypothetical protein
MYVVLIAITKVEQVELVQVIFGQLRSKLSPRVAVSAIGCGSEVNFFSANKIFDYVSTTILKRRCFAHGSCSNVKVNGCSGVADWDVVYPDLVHFNWWIGVSCVDDCS